MGLTPRIWQPLLRFGLALAAGLLVCGCGSTDAAQEIDSRSPTVVLLTRHAEKVDASDDPALSAIGQRRADDLLHALEHSGVTAIYTSTLRRTRDTATPLAERLGLAVEQLPPDQDAELVRRIREQHAGDVVLVVGHSNTVPKVIEALCGAKVTIGDADYDGLFTVVLPASGAPRLVRLAYGARTDR